MRAFWTVIHRWAGLTIALFLIVAGLTGAVTSWDHELDEWLNADIMETPGRGPCSGRSCWRKKWPPPIRAWKSIT